MEYIGLVDCNNFFVSCERLFRPDLLRVPVVVLSSNDGCIIARSKEVKDMGIPMGVPYFKVKEVLTKNDTVIFSTNFTLYRDISARVMKVLREEVGNVEQYSVDEAFIRFRAQDKQEASDLLANLKSQIEKRVGIPVSLGAGKSKTIAKCATTKAKSSEKGVTILAGKEWFEVAKDWPLANIWGVGKRLNERMKQANLYYAKDLIGADSGVLRNLFGVYGNRLQTELSEKPFYSSSEDGYKQDQKSLMHTKSFKKPSTSYNVVADALAYHISMAGKDLRDQRQATKNIRVLIYPSRHNQWALKGGSLEATLEAPTNDTTHLLKVANKLLDSLYESGVPYKKAGVVFSDLVDESYLSLSMFDKEKHKSNRELFAYIDGINNKYGKQTVSLGRTGKEAEWQPSREYISPHYTTKWSDLKTVMA